MNKRIYIILILIAVTFGYAIVQSLVLEKKLADNRVLESNSVLQELPQVTMPIYKEEASVDFIEANKEQTLVVHFWASWCGPCEKEFPTLIKLTEELVDNESIKFLFVIVNDTPKEIDKFLSKFPALSKNVTLLVDNESLHQK